MVGLLFKASSFVGRKARKGNDAGVDSPVMTVSSSGMVARWAMTDGT